MLEGHAEEQHDRHPHRDHLAAHRGRDHGADHAGGDHPVAQDAADEQRQHAGGAVRLVGVRVTPMLASVTPTLSGGEEKPKVTTIAIMTATVKAPAKLPMNTSPQLRSTPSAVTPGRLSIHANGASTNT